MLIPDYIFIGTFVLLLLILVLQIFSDELNIPFYPRISLYALVSLFALGFSFPFCDIIYVVKGRSGTTRYYSWGGAKYNTRNKIVNIMNDQDGNLVIIEMAENTIEDAEL